MDLVLLPIIELFTIKFNRYNEILEIKKNNFPTNRPIAEKQGRVRGNKNIFKAGPSYGHVWTVTSNFVGLLSDIEMN